MSMTSSLNIQFTGELRRFINEQASDDGVYATPSEYIRDLVRRDMEERSKAREREIAAMLMDARSSAVTKISSNFIQTERALLKES